MRIAQALNALDFIRPQQEEVSAIKEGLATESVKCLLPAAPVAVFGDSRSLTYQTADSRDCIRCQGWFGIAQHAQCRLDLKPIATGEPAGLAALVAVIMSL